MGIVRMVPLFHHRTRIARSEPARCLVPRRFAVTVIKFIERQLSARRHTVPFAGSPWESRLCPAISRSKKSRPSFAARPVLERKRRAFLLAEKATEMGWNRF